MAPSPLEFFLVLHGQTDAHVQGRVCGPQWDVPLNDEGLKQARRLSKSLVRERLGIRVIFSSPALRCIQTTDVLHDALKVKVRVISGLSERGMGEWERAEMGSIPGFSPEVEQIPGGESLNRFRARVQEAVNFVMDGASASGGSALIVTHGFFGAAIASLFGAQGTKFERCVLYRFFKDSPVAPWRFETLSSPGAGSG